VITRLARTSRGWIAIEFTEGRPWGTGVLTITFDEEGRGGDAKRWTTRYGYGPGPLPFDDFLVNEAELPPEEASELADKVLGPWLEEWRREGGQADTRAFNRFYVRFMAGVLATVALAFLGFALIVWRLTDWIG
jgi:hypothetical protein